MQSSNSVLSFYFDMLFDNSIQSVKDSFRIKSKSCGVSKKGRSLNEKIQCHQIHY